MKRTVSILLALILTLSVLGGCGSSAAQTPSAPAPSTPAPSTPAPSTPAPSTPTPSAPADGGYTPENYPWHDVYKIDDPSFWNGVMMQVDYMSRAGFDKALPKTKKTPDQIKVGMVTSQTGNTFFEQMFDEADIAREEFGYEVSYLSANNDVDRMIRALEDYTAQGVDVILLDPVDRDTADIAIRTCVANGTAVIQIGIGIGTQVPAITSITGNYWGSGYEGGKYTMSQLKDYPTIKAVLSVGRLGSNTRPCGMITGMIEERSRQKGTPISKDDAMLLAYNYTTKMFQQGSIEIPEADLYIASVDTTAGFTVEGGVSAAENLMTAVPDAQLFIAESDSIAIGALRGLENLGYKPGEDLLVTTFNDGLQEAAEYVKAGKLMMTGYNPPSLFVNGAFNLIKMIWEEGFDASNMPAICPLPAVAINKDNVDMYLNPGNPYVKALDPVTFKTIAQQWDDFLAANPVQ